MNSHARGLMRCRVCHHRPIVWKCASMWFARCPLQGPRGYRRYRLHRTECFTFCLWTLRDIRRAWNEYMQERWKGTMFA